MQDNTTLARPYAKAAFEYATQQGSLDQWSQRLHFAGAVVQNKHMAALLHDPRYTTEQILALFVALAEDKAGSQADADKWHNFLSLLAQNQRLGVLAEIAELFSQLQAEHERTLRVQITSVVELTAQQRDILLRSLEQKLHKKIMLDFLLDPYILGGISIRAGDKVIDLTLLGQLQQMNATLKTA